MNAVANAELVSSYLGRWSPTDLAFVEEISFAAATVDEDSAVRMTALFQRQDRGERWPSFDRPFLRVRLLFSGIRQLSMRGFGPGKKQFTGFDIVDVRERQQEGVRFAIEDYEAGNLSFFCNSISVLSVEGEERIE